jgi:hypothetical protein
MRHVFVFMATGVICVCFHDKWGYLYFCQRQLGWQGMFYTDGGTRYMSVKSGVTMHVPMTKWHDKKRLCLYSICRKDRCRYKWEDRHCVDIFVKVITVINTLWWHNLCIISSQTFKKFFINICKLKRGGVPCDVSMTKWGDMFVSMKSGLSWVCVHDKSGDVYVSLLSGLIYLYPWQMGCLLFVYLTSRLTCVCIHNKLHWYSNFSHFPHFFTNLLQYPCPDWPQYKSVIFQFFTDIAQKIYFKKITRTFLRFLFLPFT